MISIIIPVYNAEPFLNKCIGSLLAQTFEKWEAIFVNDGSTDGSSKILREYAQADSRIRIIEKENGGVSSASNRGLSAARAQFISFLDADDYFQPTTLQTLYDAITRYNCGMSCCLMTRIYSNGRAESETSRFDDGEHPASAENVFSFEMRAPWAKLFRRDIIDKYRIRFPEGISICEDDVFVVSYWSHIQRFAMVNEALYNYLQPETSALHRAISGKMTYNAYERTLDVPLLIYEHIVSYIQDERVLKLWGTILIRYFFYLSTWMQSCCHSSSYAEGIRNYELSHARVFRQNIRPLTIHIIRAKVYVPYVIKSKIKRLIKIISKH